MTPGRRRGWHRFRIGLPYLALVLLHLGVSRGIDRPSIFFDELGYLANARYLAGVAPLPYFPVETPYHFGYSLFLIPIFWLFSDPLTAYRAILIVNAILLSSLYFPLYWLLRRLFAVGVARAAVIALVACLYPAFVLQSDHAWAENAFIPFYPWTIVALACLLNRPGPRNAVLFGAATGFLYTLHPRALLIPPVVGVGLVCLAWAKVVPRRSALFSLLAMAAVVLGTVMLNRHLQRGISHLPQDAHEAHVAAARRLLSWSGLSGLAVAACGQLLYLLQATYGLFGLGLMFLINDLKSFRGNKAQPLGRTELSLEKSLDDEGQDGGNQPRCFSGAGSMNPAGACPLPALPRVGALLFLLLTSLAIFLASSVAMLQPTRSDHILYGRYNEGFLAVYLALALLRLDMAPRSWTAAGRDLAVIGLPMFLLTGIVVEAHASPVLSGSVVDVNILGILPAFHTLARSRSGVGHALTEALDLGAITALSLVVMALLRMVVTRGFALGLVLIAGLFLAVTSYGYQRLCLDQQTSERAASLAARIQEMGDVSGVSYDLSSFDPRRPRCYCLTQYLLGRNALDLFFSGRGELPRSRMVISGPDWLSANSLRARLVLEETMTGHALWLLPAVPVGSASPDGYLNVRLGHQPIEGIAENGFYQPEDARGEESGRWTNGAARLTVPLRGKTPRALALALGPKAAHQILVWVRVNGREVYRGRAGPGLSDVVVPLEGALLGDRVTIEILSETFVPRERQPGSEDARQLGIFLRGVRLLLFQVDE